MTSTANTLLTYWKEDAYPDGYAVQPAAIDATVMRTSGEQLKVLPTGIESPEITAGNETADIIINGRDGASQLSVPWSYATLDDFMAAICGGAWDGTTAPINDGSIDVSFTAATRTLTRASGSWTSTPTASQVISVRGFGNAYLDNVFEVESATATTIVLLADGTDFAGIGDQAATADVIIKRGEKLENAASPTIQTFGFEKKIIRPSATDYIRILGFLPSQFQMSAQGANFFTGSISGFAALEENGVSSWDGTPNAANTNNTFSGFSDVKKVRFRNTATSTNYLICPQATTIQFGNNAEEIPVQCPAQKSEINLRDFTAGINITGIYDGPHYSSMALANQAGIVEVSLRDSAGNAYRVKLARAKLSNASRFISGRGDIIQSVIEARAVKTGTADRMLQIWRIPA